MIAEILIPCVNVILAIIAALIGASNKIPGFPVLPQVISQKVYVICALIFGIFSFSSWLYISDYSNPHDYPGDYGLFWVFFELISSAGICALFIGVLGSTHHRPNIGYVGWGVAVFYFLIIINSILFGLVEDSSLEGTKIINITTGFQIFVFLVCIASNFGILTVTGCFRKIGPPIKPNSK